MNVTLSFTVSGADLAALIASAENELERFDPRGEWEIFVRAEPLVRSTDQVALWEGEVTAWRK